MRMVQFKCILYTLPSQPYKIFERLNLINRAGISPIFNFNCAEGGDTLIQPNLQGEHVYLSCKVEL